MFSLLCGVLFAGLHVSGPRQFEVYAAYWKLPHTTTLLDFATVPEKEWKNGDGILGVYWPGRRHAEVIDSLEPNAFAVCVAHEYGHHYWFTNSNENKRKVWEDFWKANLDLMPREYAKVNREEGFAECFSTRFIGTNCYLYDAPLSPIVAKKIDEWLLISSVQKNAIGRPVPPLINTDLSFVNLGRRSPTTIKKNR